MTSAGQLLWLLNKKQPEGLWCLIVVLMAVPQLEGKKSPLALLWQILAIDWRNWIPESDFQ